MARQTKIDEVVETLSQRITEGFYQPGERLPAAEDIAEELHVSRQTIRSALERLEADNKVDIRPSSGTYVCEPVLTSLLGPVRKRQRSPGEHLLAREISYRFSFPSGIFLADERLAEKMEIAERTPLLRQHRVYFINQVPYRIVDAYYSLALLQTLPESDDDPIKWLRKYVEQPRLSFPEAFESVSCRMPDEREINYLNLRKNQPVLDIERWISVENDRVFAYTHIVANPVLHEFTYTYRQSNWEDLIDKVLMESPLSQFQWLE